MIIPFYRWIVTLAPFDWKLLHKWNDFMRVAFPNLEVISCPVNLRERRTFSRNYVRNSSFLQTVFENYSRHVILVSIFLVGWVILWRLVCESIWFVQTIQAGQRRPEMIARIQAGDVLCSGLNAAFLSPIFGGKCSGTPNPYNLSKSTALLFVQHQGATKGGWQKEFDHFFSSLVTFW